MTRTPAVSAAHVVTIPGWVPPSVNRLLKAHWAVAHRIKRKACERIALECLAARIPPATGPRRVRLAVTVANRGHRPDPDNLLKCVLDALVNCRALLDDSAGHCVATPPAVRAGRDRQTIIILEDI
jgi:Holliday junction resolvase RusA-like endonuclease